VDFTTGASAFSFLPENIFAPAFLRNENKPISFVLIII
jgi:hypothetical protein